MFDVKKALFSTSGPKYSWKKVALVLILSSLAAFSFAWMGYALYLYVQRLQRTQAGSLIQAIIQTSEQYTHLQTAYLAEVLDLSADRPVASHHFDLEEAKRKLLASIIIKDVRLKKVKHDLLFIQYSTRIPIALLENYTNTAIDEEGVLFPYSPFYSPRSLPYIYLGSPPSQPWGEKINKKILLLMQTLFSSLGTEKIKRIDLSFADSGSSGRRELVILLKCGTILRLTPKNCVQQLSNYTTLQKTLLKDEHAKII